MRLFLLLAFLPLVFGSDVIWRSSPTELLKEIFEITELKEVNDLGLAAAQSNLKWVRPKFMEGWHAYSLLDKKKKQRLADLFKKSEFATRRIPKKQHYDAVFIIGHFSDRIQRRIDYLIKLHKKGIKFDRIYLLGITRPLKTGSSFDRFAVLPEKCVTVIEVMWENSKKPESLKLVPVSVVKAHKIDDCYGSTSRKLIEQMKNSFETVEGNSFLLVSDGLYGCNQGALAEKVLCPYGAEVETVWGKMPVYESVEILLDSVAKCLYHLHELHELNAKHG